jgi:glutathione synthase/RimK-type ligase-like ATP-grasp enzyme
MIKAIGIYRENALAGKVNADKNILELTGSYLKQNNFDVSFKDQSEVNYDTNADIIFSMARGKDINEILSKKNIIFFNKPQAIMQTLNRKEVYKKMMEVGANLPNTRILLLSEISFDDISRKSILKPASRHEFWFIVENSDDFNKAIDEYKDNNINEIIVQDFVEGEHVKFYGINDEVFLPLKTNEYPEETINKIKKQIKIVREITGLDIYGGDFIIKEKPYCIDFNDWPSFGSVEGYTQEEMGPKIGKFVLEEFNKTL